MNAQRGFTLIELMIALALIALAIGTAIALWPGGKATAQGLTGLADLQEIAEKLSDDLGFQRDGYVGLTTQLAIERGAVPARLIVPGRTATARMAWGSSLQIGNKDGQFTLSFNPPDAEACSVIAGSLAQSKTFDRLERTGGVTVDAWSPTNPATQNRIAEAIRQACDEAGGSKPSWRLYGI